MTSYNRKPKVALIYDRVNTSYGGAEHVLKAIGEIFPNAPLFTSVYSKNKSGWANSFKVVPSFLQRIKFLRNNHQFLALLMPLAFESLKLESFDIIISITSAEAKGVMTKPNQLHICYMLTPTRYLYSHRSEYLKSQKIFNYQLVKWLANLSLNYISRWDKVAAHKIDIIIPISNLVKDRVKKYYNLNTDAVIYPPVNISLRNNKFSPKNSEKNKTNSYYLSISRLVSYKKVNLSIEAAIKLDKTLVVVGNGTQKNNLKKNAGNNYIEKQPNESITKLFNRAKQENKKIIFTQKLPNNQVNWLLENCKALIMPGEEDFGITGLEASILGKPVIVFYRSGVAELLKDGVDSVFTKEETKEEVIKAIKKLEKTNFNTQLIKSRAKKHNTKKFKKEFEKKVLDSWKKFIEGTLCHT